MDNCESDKQQNTEGEESKDGDPLSDARYVFQPLWLRYSSKIGVGFDRFVLGYNGYLLPCCGFVFWTLFLLLKT